MATSYKTGITPPRPYEEIDRSTIAGRIKYYRLLKGFTQKELASLIGVETCSIIKYEDSKYNSRSLHICEKICKALEARKEEVYDEYLLFIDSDFQSTLKSFRKKHNLSMAELSILIGGEKKTVARWESRGMTPTRRSYERMIKPWLTTLQADHSTPKCEPGCQQGVSTHVKILPKNN